MAVEMRNVLAHAYFVGLSVKLVWDTTPTRINGLENAVRSLLE